MNLKLPGTYKWTINTLEENQIKMHDIYPHLSSVFSDGALCQYLLILYCYTHYIFVTNK